jgi:diguanylate cyclase (GGDEF)-like protein
VTNSLRKQDHLFRYGGDEFVILSDGLAHGSAFVLGERLRRAVELVTAEEPGGPITVSVGVATCPLDALTVDRLFAVADERLFTAKHAGRNRVIGRDTSLGGDGTPNG